MSDWHVPRNYDYGDLTHDEVVAELRKIADEHRGARAHASPEAVAFLFEHGGPNIVSPDRVSVRQGRAEVAARTLSDMICSAFTLRQAAQALGAEPDDVTDRIADQTLWAFAISGRPYLPRWQFLDDGHLLPGLDVIVPAIPRGLHPLEVEGFMKRVRIDFDDMSPVEWLAAHRDPTIIVEWLVEVGNI